MAALPTFEDIQRLDAEDPLKAFRAEFDLPEGLIYLDGNSLGASPKAALAALDIAARDEWRRGLVGSWNEAGWAALPLTLGDTIGGLIGAGPGQVVVSDSTSVNIFKALAAAVGLRPGRKTILAEADSFPTDIYMAEGFASQVPGIELKLEGIDGDSIEDMLGDDVAAVLVNHVNYRTGRLRDMKALTRKVHAAGALVIWDLCHSVGALPIGLDADTVDFAVGCTYKYLNGGPGAPAFIYAATRHHPAARQPLSGWWGHARPFAFENRYEHNAYIAKFLCGTQPILSMRSLQGALAVWEGVDMEALRTKSLKLTDLFIDLVEAHCSEHGLKLETPREHALRGSQVTISHPAAYQMVQALIEKGVVGDFRAPDALRFGFTPLYLRYVDVWNAVEQLRKILVSGEWQEDRFTQRHAVT